MIVFAWLLCVFAIGPITDAQPPKPVHDRLTSCHHQEDAEQQPTCFLNYYCTHAQGVCVPCPREGVGVTEDDCRRDIEEPKQQQQFASPVVDPSDRSASLDLRSCVQNCIRHQEGEYCTVADGCEEEHFFCNYQRTFVEEASSSNSGSDSDDENNDDAAETSATLPPGVERNGTCAPCKSDPADCLTDPNITSVFGQEDCILCDSTFSCVPLQFSTVVQRHDDSNTTTLLSLALKDSQPGVVTGPVTDCTNLMHNDQITCVRGVDPTNARIDGKICLVNDYIHNTPHYGVVDKCKELGGIGVVFYGDYSPFFSLDLPWAGDLSYQWNAQVPAVAISYNEAERLQAEIVAAEVPPILTLNVTHVGQECYKEQFCSDRVPCLGNSNDKYCDYKWGGDHGACVQCPRDPDTGKPSPLSCFFSEEQYGEVLDQKAVESCADNCATKLEFPACKFCPREGSGFDFMSPQEVLTNKPCEFCPYDDVQFPDKEFPLFGAGVKCWQVQKFFKEVKLKPGSINCRLANKFSYVCGCEGSGYGGATTKAKKAALAWMPRISAILSFAGSSYIIYDLLFDLDRRKKVANILLMGLSAFDIVGSCAYMFTTLAMPADDPFGPIYGAHGNDSTCIAQAFFLQVGTISAYMNVSLSVYYFLVIHNGWQESRVRTVLPSLVLVPVIVGLAFAFAGIPFYGPLILWCNNQASYWPDIMVAVAIGLATVIMTRICWVVYKKDRKAGRWRMRASTTNSPDLSTRVFWQSFFYLLSFYATWCPYLALQYSWAGGKAFARYGWILAAGTMVPLQGFWNMMVYVRRRIDFLGGLCNCFCGGNRGQSREGSGASGLLSWFNISRFTETSRVLSTGVSGHENLGRSKTSGADEAAHDAGCGAKPDMGEGLALGNINALKQTEMNWGGAMSCSFADEAHGQGVQLTSLPEKA